MKKSGFYNRFANLGSKPTSLTWISNTALPGFRDGYESQLVSDEYRKDASFEFGRVDILSEPGHYLITQRNRYPLFDEVLISIAIDVNCSRSSSSLCFHSSRPKGVAWRGVAWRAVLSAWSALPTKT